MAIAVARTGLFAAHDGDGVRTWAGTTFVIERTAAGGPDTWTYNTQFPNTTHQSAYDIGADVLTWLQAGGRPWAGAGVTFTFTPTTGADGLRMGVRWTASEAFEWNPSADLESLLGLPASAAAATTFETAAPNGALASVDAPVEMRHWYRRVVRPGARSRAGSWHPDAQPVANFRPDCTLHLPTDAHVWALTELQEHSSSPRAGWVYDKAAATWRAVQIAKIGPHRQGTYSLYSAPVEVVG